MYGLDFSTANSTVDFFKLLNTSVSVYERMAQIADDFFVIVLAMNQYCPSPKSEPHVSNIKGTLKSGYFKIGPDTSCCFKLFKGSS